MIYVDEHIGRIDVAAALEAVSQQRREHAIRYRQERDRRLSLAVYLLLCRGLKEEYGITEPPVFEFGDHGKPMLASRPDIHFNMSHCREAAACVIADHPVGIDVESIRAYDQELIERTMNEDEQRLITHSLTPREEFTRLWTMKESVLKLTGKGISEDLHHVLDDAIRYRFVTECRNGYIYTWCEYNNN
ncbi:MAG: 4'-phosphopantetheinyl transferase superfamily protein [Muribaculaceae bacterium]|nr:4'-phosphopantetheinyl transferase superfamily protein [Muribaculaceae bacterium]